jgi:hypothetical protein
MLTTFPRLAATLTLLLTTYIAISSESQAQGLPERVRRIDWYYLPFSAFARYNIDSFNIRNNQNGCVRRPTAFLLRVHRSLGYRPVESARAFEHGEVRMLFDITYASGRIETLQMDGSRTVLWRHHHYRADSTIQAVFLSVFTRKQQKRMHLGPYAIKRR